jgi:hypothetical protein
MTWKLHVRHQDRERYARHAAIQSIEAELAKAERGMRDAANEINWLRELAKTRMWQMANGTWPPAVPDLGRRIEDEGLTGRQMDEERARDEDERDENGETE